MLLIIILRNYGIMPSRGSIPKLLKLSQKRYLYGVDMLVNKNSDFIKAFHTAADPGTGKDVILYFEG